MKLARLLEVEQVVPQGSDAILLSFRVSGGDVEAFRFQPGQYLTLAVDIDGVPHWRCYSITSEPSALPLVSVLVRRVDGGRASNWLCDHVRPGTRIEVLPPAGRFTLRNPCQPALMFAGGSGIAPIFSLARHALEQGASRVMLFYANRNRSTVMLEAALDELRVAAPGRLDVTQWFDGELGFPTADVMRDHALGLDGSDVYLCGPEPFMKTVRAGLKQAGVEAQRIHYEDFGVAEEDGSAVEKSGPAVERTLTVSLRGTQHTVTVKDHETLLSAMIQAGLTVPHACKVGECASCICRLEKGDIERLENSVLDEDDVADGVLLACRSRAVSEHVRIRFS
jgi:3-ketosteroid 9alpha-monooxygenase subunit B